MNPEANEPAVIRAARHLFLPADVNRYLVPLAADIQHEQAQALGKRAVLGSHAIGWRGLLQLLRMAVWLATLEHRRTSQRSQWLAFLPATLAVAIGCAGMAWQGLEHMGALQLGWLCLAAGVAAWAATLPARLWTAVASPLGWLSVTALTATAAFGVSYEGATRWMRLGPVQVHASQLVLPLLLMAFCVLVGSGRRLQAGAMVVASLAVLALQPDGHAAVALAVGVTVAAAALRTPLPMTAGVAVTAAPLSAWAMLRDPALSSAAHVEGALVQLAQTNLLAATAATLALFVSMALLLRGSIQRSGVGTISTGLAAASASMLLTLVVLGLVHEAGIPLVSYGGSSVVGWFMALALASSFSAARPSVQPSVN